MEGIDTVEADVRDLPFAADSFDQVLLVSTLEHIGADNTVYGLEVEGDPTLALPRCGSSGASCARAGACS